MIRCIAVDDEAYATRLIAGYISKIPFLELVGTMTSAIEALALIQQGDIDLVFMDIQMPDLTGIQFLKLLGSKCKVILTTAYPEYALEGYEHDVVDYLLKPIAFDRFYKAADKARMQLSLPGQDKSQTATNLAQNQNIGVVGNDYMFIKGDSKNKFVKVDFDHILYVEGMKNYVSIFTDEQRLVTYQSLRDLEQQLPQPPFYRIHKSYIISINKIRQIDGNQIYIGENSIPIGETYRGPFLQMIRDRADL